MSKKKQPTRKRKVRVVKVERPSFPTLVTLAVHEPIPLPEVALPSEPVEVEVGDFNDYAADKSAKNGGVLTDSNTITLWCSALTASASLVRVSNSEHRRHPTRRH